MLAVGFLTMGALAANGSAVRSWGPPRIIAQSKDIQVTEGESVQLEVKFETGHVNTNLEIIHNGKQLSENERIIVTFQYGLVILHIKEVHLEDAGEYQFRLTNPLGTVSAYIKLYVAMPQ